MIEGEVPAGLFLRGDLQMDTAERALRRHKADSKALKLIVDLKGLYSQQQKQGQSSRSSISLYVADAQMKEDLMHSLSEELKRTDLDDFDRAGIEELLHIQRYGKD